MGHHIQGFIARAEELSRAAAGLTGARVVPALRGFGFLPVTEQLVGDDDLVPFEHLSRLTAELASWAEAASIAFPLAYVETEYFGGVGSQAAMAWVSGRAAFGPVQTTDMEIDGKQTSVPFLEGAINQALRVVGVDRGAVRDEFECVGLGLHRSNDTWLPESNS